MQTPKDQKSSTPGKLIVIAGTDASGKGTQAALLVDALEKQGKKVKLYDFPNYDSVFGKLIARYLRGELGSLESMNPYVTSLLYANDRLLQRDKLLADLAAGTIVICNRYVESNLAHQGTKVARNERSAFIHWVLDLEHKTFGLPKPSATVFLYVPYAFRMKLVEKKDTRAYLGKKGKDLHEASMDHQVVAEEIYLSLAKDQGWKKIDCVQKEKMRSIDDIQKEVHEIVKQVLMR